jgi:hypothetical protein
LQDKGAPAVRAIELPSAAAFVDVNEDMTQNKYEVKIIFFAIQINSLITLTSLPFEWPALSNISSSIQRKQKGV